MTDEAKQLAPDESPESRPRERRRRERSQGRARRPSKLRRRLDRLARRTRRAAKNYPTPFFVASFSFLNVMLNARYPGREPAFWYLLPSIDLLVVFVYLAWFGALGWKVPRAVRIALVACVFLVRFIRLGDGIQDRFFATQFNLYTDLPLFPELLRFVHSSLGGGAFALALLGSVLALGALAWLTYGAVAHVEAYLAKRRQLYVGLGVTAAVVFLGSSIGHEPRFDELFLIDGVAASATPRLKNEALFLVNVYDAKASYAVAINAAQERLDRIPNDLGKLRGANVHLIVVESYGQSSLEWPPHVSALKSTFDHFESSLGAKGFSILTGILDSPTYGGQSWLAHATIGTGIKVTNQLEYELVLAKKPRSLASFFVDAGYRTVLVAPGTSRPWPKGEFYKFEQKYFGWEFGYEGPWFAWARMPDQFVLDFVRRRELARPSRPLFIQYQLVSSHAPWSDLPKIVDDWDSLGDGSIFERIGRIKYPIVWPNFENASDAYAHSIKYDFQILEQYIGRYIEDGSLIIILGDHQPVWDVNGHSGAMGVPIHVLSRNPALVEPFRALGYTPGLRKTPRGSYAGLESFLPDLLIALSNAPR